MPNTGYFKVASVLKPCLFLVTIRNSVFSQVSIASFFVWKNSFSRQIYKTIKYFCFGKYKSILEILVLR